MSTQEQLDRLTGIVESLAASVARHDDQIGDLLKAAEEWEKKKAELRRSMAKNKLI